MFLLNFIFVLCIGAISEIEGSLTVVYVSEDGSDNISCGNVLSPCRHLSVAVEKVNSNGTIRVNGTQTLNETITIRKHVDIIGIDNTKTIIDGNAIFAFVNLFLFLVVQANKKV